MISVEQGTDEQRQMVFWAASLKPASLKQQDRYRKPGGEEGKWGKEIGGGVGNGGVIFNNK